MTASRSSGPTNKPTAAGDSRRTPRKPYSAPKLQVYGSVAKLTRNGQGTKGDGGTMPGMTSMTCL